MLLGGKELIVPALIRFLVDFGLFLAATALAFLLRENFDPSFQRLMSVAPYFAATAALAFIILPLFRLNHTIWRLSSLHNYLWILAAVFVIIAGAIGLTFAYNRLDGVSRTLPVLQALLAIWLLVGARVLLRLRHGIRQARREKNAPLKIAKDQAAEIILLVGLSQRAETYLRTVAELAQLFNILRGDMSFIGPRPLLLRDQSAADSARLLVRPGLTGWAQVIGGRDISPEDKAVLDVCYVHNASLKLDFEICLRTIPMVLTGERINSLQVARLERFCACEVSYAAKRNWIAQLDKGATTSQAA